MLDYLQNKLLSYLRRRMPPTTSPSFIPELLMEIVWLSVKLAIGWFFFLDILFKEFDPQTRAFMDSTRARKTRDEEELYRQDSIRQEEERLEKNRKHEAFLRAVQERKDSIRRFDSARIGYFLYRLDSVRETGINSRK